MKPSYNAISTAGQSTFSVTYDTTGFFARSLDDLQLVADVFAIKDDEPTEDVALKDMKVAMIKTPMWSQAGPGTVSAFEKAAKILAAHGVNVQDVSLPTEINDAGVLERLQVAITSGEAQVAFLREYRVGKSQLAREICDIVENSTNITQKERLQAFDKYGRMRALVDDLATQYSIILAPSAIDEAPLGLDDMGSPLFNTFWTVSTHKRIE